MAYIKWSGHTLNTAASATAVTIPTAAGVTAGDGVVVFWLAPYSAGSSVTYANLGTNAPTSSAGAMTVTSPPDADNGVGTRFHTYRRVATASDSGSTITAASPGTGNKALVVVVVGGTTGAVDGTPTKATTSATTVAAPAITTTSGYGALIVIAMWGAANTITAPTGFTVAQQNTGFAVSTAIQTATGTTGTKTSTASTSAVCSTGFLVINGNNTAPPTASVRSGRFIPFFGI